MPKQTAKTEEDQKRKFLPLSLRRVMPLPSGFSLKENAITRS
jgi:hypothetical protein